MDKPLLYYYHTTFHINEIIQAGRTDSMSCKYTLRTPLYIRIQITRPTLFQTVICQSINSRQYSIKYLHITFTSIQNMQFSQFAILYHRPANRYCNVSILTSTYIKSVKSNPLSKYMHITLNICHKHFVKKSFL